MTIIIISGSVGSGKTTISSELGLKLNFKVVHLNEKAKEFKLNDISELQTFDFDLDKLLDKVEAEIKISRQNKENIIYEGHFAHFINPKLVDVIFVINRDLKELKKEYNNREYNTQKIEDNLEVENFNLCFYEAIEQGYIEEKQVFSINNDEDVIDICSNLKRKLKKLNLFD